MNVVTQFYRAVSNGLARARHERERARVREAFDFLIERGELPFVGFSGSGDTFDSYDAMMLSDQLASYFASDPQFSTAVMMPAEIIAGWPIRIMRRDGDVLRPVRPGHRADTLINRKPNDFQTPFAFKVELLSWLRMVGNSYVRMIRMTDGAPPTGLWILDPNRVTHKKHPTRGVSVYEHTIGGRREPIDPADVLLFRLFNPRDNVVGQGIGAPLKSTLRMRAAAWRFNRSFLENDGKPSDLFFSSTGNVTEKQALAAEERYHTKFGQGGSGHGRSMFLHQWKPEVISRAPQELQFAELLDHMTESLASGGRVPQGLLGYLKHATYSNIDAQREHLVDFTCIPLATYALEVINTRLLSLFDPSLVATFDLSSEPVMVKRRIAMIERVEALANPAGGRAIITVNEARELVRRLMPTIADAIKGDIAGGNAMLVPLNLVPVDLAIERAHAETDDIVLSTAQAIDDTPLAKALTKLAPDETPDVLASFIDGLSTVRADEKPKAPAIVRASDLAVSEIEGLLGWADGFEERAVKASRAFHRSVMKERGSAVMRGLGAGAFNMSNDFVTEYLLKKPQRFADNWPKTVLKNLRLGLEDGVTGGETVQELATRVDRIFNGLKNNALTVARTEATPAFNAASHAAWKQSGVVDKKEWLNNTDRHAYVAGYSIGVDERWTLEESSVLYPGDPDGAPGDIINCGCTDVAITKAKSISDEHLVIGRAAGSSQIREQLRLARRFERVLRSMLNRALAETLDGLDAKKPRKASDDALARMVRNGKGVTT